MMPDPPQDVLRLLPHRPPFVMIDKLVVDGQGPARSSFRILPDNVLISEGYFSEAGLVENIAQTAGAAAGISAQSAGRDPVVGYIGALKDLKVFSLPPVGQTLETEVIFVHQVMQAQIVRGTVFCEGQLIASCELKIFLQS